MPQQPEFELPPHISSNFKSKEDEREYKEKIRRLARYEPRIRDRIPLADQTSAQKLMYAIKGINFEHYLSPENIKGIEIFINRDVLQSYPQQQLNDNMHMMQDNMHQQNQYHHQNMPSSVNSSWPPHAWQQGPPSTHSPNAPPHMAYSNGQYMTPGSYPSSSAYNQPTQQMQTGRPSPYPLPPHHKMYTSNNMMHQQQQQQQPPSSSSYQQQPQYPYMNNAQMHSMPPQQQMMPNGQNGLPPNLMNGYDDPTRGAQPMDMNNGMPMHDYGMGQPMSVDPLNNSILMKLPEQARNEFLNFDQRISCNHIENGADGMSLVVVCQYSKFSTFYFTIPIFLCLSNIDYFQNESKFPTSVYSSPATIHNNWPLLNALR